MKNTQKENESKHNLHIKKSVPSVRASQWYYVLRDILTKYVLRFYLKNYLI